VNERRRGLGRGLGALIPTAPTVGDTASPGPSPVDVLIPGRAHPADAAGSEQPVDQAGATGNGDAYFAEIPIHAVAPNPRQPRTVFDQDAMAELVHSLGEVGLLQPVVVRPVDGGRYELVMGERRWRAAQQAGFESIPAIVRPTDDTAMLRDALLENLHRSQLNPLEEAAAYDQMLEDFGCTHDELAARIGRSRPQISNTLRLLRLSPAVQRRIAAGVLSAGHARALLGLPDQGAQDRLAGRIVAEGLSVRTVEEIVALGDLDTADADAVADADMAAGSSAGGRRRGRRPVAPKLAVLADHLSNRFETRVKVDLGRARGRIVVEFASVDDLERIVALMAPDLGTEPDVATEPEQFGTEPEQFRTEPNAALGADAHVERL